VRQTVGGGQTDSVRSACRGRREEKGPAQIDEHIAIVSAGYFRPPPEGRRRRGLERVEKVERVRGIFRELEEVRGTQR